MKDNEKQLLEHCKKAIEESVTNAGGVIAFVNQFIVVPDEDSTIRVVSHAMDAVLKIQDELENDWCYIMVGKVLLEKDSTLKVHLIVSVFDSDETGEVVYKNNQCTVTWNKDEKFDAHSVMSFYQIPEPAISGANYKDVWEKYVETKVVGVSCRNILKLGLLPEQVVAELAHKEFRGGPIGKAIQDERSNGANYVFIKPVCGAPIDGYEIDGLMGNE